MRAVLVERLEGPSGVRLADVPEPAGDGLVVVDVHAAGVAFPDLLQTRGGYQVRPELPFVPGAEAAGVVRFAPSEATVRPGDRVVAFGSGMWAEVVAVPGPSVFPLPDVVGFEAGAGMVLNPLTAHFVLLRRAGMRPGDTVLVHGAAGGVGTAVLALVRALGGRGIAVVSSAAKAEVARRAGADDVVLVGGWLDAVRALTGGRGVDIAVDPVGGDRFTDTVRSLASEGRVVVVGFTGGEIPTVKVNRLLLRNVSVVGAGWGEYVRSHPGFVREQWDELVPLLASGAYRPLVGPTFPLAQAAEALGILDRREAVGKVTLLLR